MTLQVARSPQLYNPNPHGCVLFLPLWHDELSGGVFSSVDDFRHICTVTGALWRPSGRFFDGNDDKITFPSLGIGANGTASVIMWFRLDTTATVKGAPISLLGDWLYQNNANNYLYAPGGAYNWAGGPAANIWYHLAVTWAGNSTTAILYHDTIAVAAIGTWAMSAFTTTIGNATNSMSGLVGEFRVYKDRVLTAAEVAHDRNATKWRYQ